MIFVAAATVLCHLWVIIKGILFFRHRGRGRERDKSIVATLSFLSFMYIVMLVMGWFEVPWRTVSQTIGLTMMIGFTFANSFFYLGLITTLTENKEWDYLRKQQSQPSSPL